MVSQDQLRALALEPALVRHGDIRNFIQYELLSVVAAVPQLDSPKFDYLKTEVARQMALKRSFSGLATNCNKLIESMSCDVGAQGALRMGESLRLPLNAAVDDVASLLNLVTQLQAEIPLSSAPLILACLSATGPVAADVLSHAWNASLDFEKANASQGSLEEGASLASSGTNNVLAALLFASGTIFGGCALKYYLSHRGTPLAELSKALNQLKSALDLVASCLGNAEALEGLCVDIRAVLGARELQANGQSAVVPLSGVPALSQAKSPAALPLTEARIVV